MTMGMNKPHRSLGQMGHDPSSWRGWPVVAVIGGVGWLALMLYAAFR